jgi:methylated-DNA-[protein]-cysteine S-methyltransferase
VHATTKILISSPVGSLLLEHDGQAVTGLRYWAAGAHPPAGTRDAPARGDLLGEETVRQLREYFAGERREFDLPLAPAGTEFQRGVWSALRGLPYGGTCTYADLARELGRRGGARAIGQANARNPIPIVVPCHRVIARGGRIGGYAGDWGEGEGIARKRWLLAHESGSLTAAANKASRRPS